MFPQKGEARETTIPLGQASRGRLVFTAGAADITLLAEAALEGLARCRFVRPVAWVGFEGGIVKVAYRHPPAENGPAGARRTGDEVVLNASIPWVIEFRGGAARIAARLGDLQLRALDILGGARQIDLELPRPAGMAYLYLAGGARQVNISRPPYVGVGIHAQDGVARLSLDGRWMDHLGSNARLESAGFRSAICRYEVGLAGEASQVTVN